MTLATRAALAFIGVGLAATLIVSPSMLALEQGYARRAPVQPAPAVEPLAEVARVAPPPRANPIPHIDPAAPATTETATPRSPPHARPVEPTPAPADTSEIQQAVIDEDAAPLAQSSSGLLPASCAERGGVSARLICENATALRREERSNSPLVTALGAALPGRNARGLAASAPEPNGTSRPPR